MTSAREHASNDATLPVLCLALNRVYSVDTITDVQLVYRPRRAVIGQSVLRGMSSAEGKEGGCSCK